MDYNIIIIAGVIFGFVWVQLSKSRTNYLLKQEQIYLSAMSKLQSADEQFAARVAIQLSISTAIHVDKRDFANILLPQSMYTDNIVSMLVYFKDKGMIGDWEFDPAFVICSETSGNNTSGLIKITGIIDQVDAVELIKTIINATEPKECANG